MQTSREKVKENNDHTKRQMIHELKWESIRKDFLENSKRVNAKKCNGGKCIWGMSGVCIRPSCNRDLR